MVEPSLDTSTSALAASPDAMTPRPYRVLSAARETADTTTLTLSPAGPALPRFRAGQFTMACVFGVGEIPVSISGDPTASDARITHTVRAVGAVSAALAAAQPGAVVGLRGPYGSSWDVPSTAGRDLVLMAGGIGLAPLRPALLEALAHRARHGRIVLLVGARSAPDLIFRKELRSWSRRADLEVAVTVDRPGGGWSGAVGVVTTLLDRVAFDAQQAIALLCGPEVMMRKSAEALLARGMGQDRIRVSLERNMRCGVAWCGHCQLGPLLLCRDGPVVGYDEAAPLLTVREL